MIVHSSKLTLYVYLFSHEPKTRFKTDTQCGATLTSISGVQRRYALRGALPLLLLTALGIRFESGPG